MRSGFGMSSSRGDAGEGRNLRHAKDGSLAAASRKSALRKAPNRATSSIATRWDKREDDAQGANHMLAVRRLHLTALVLPLLGCLATPYVPQGVSGGYSETRLNDHVFQVRFSGNGHTDWGRSCDFCLLRCAEVTLEHGCRYFEIVTESQFSEVDSYRSPQTSYTTGSVQVQGNVAYGSATTQTHGGLQVVSRPRNAQTIHCLPEAPEGAAVVDAGLVRATMLERYGDSLAVCGGCGRIISPRTKTCPRCGAPGPLHQRAEVYPGVGTLADDAQQATTEAPIERGSEGS